MRIRALVVLAAISTSAWADVNLDLYGSVDYGARTQSETANQFAVPKVSFLYSQSYGKLSFLAEALP